MCDLTPDFLALVSAISKYDKIAPTATQHTIQRRTQKEHPFILACKNVLRSLKEAEKSVQQARVVLVEESLFLRKSQTLLEQNTWEKLTSQASTKLSECRSSLAKLSDSLATAKDATKSLHHLHHYTEMLAFLQDYCDRLSRTLSLQRMDRLQHSIEQRVGYSKYRKQMASSRTLDERAEVLDKAKPVAPQLPPSKYRPAAAAATASTEAAGEASEGNGFTRKLDNKIKELSPQMLEVLEREREMIRHQLDNFASQIRDVEAKIISVAEMQSVLAFNVMKQGEDLATIGELAISSHENVIQGNVQLKSAARSGAHFRNFVLLFILMLSFTLLFLHWYE